MLISSIIPCFNAGSWIKDALASIVKQEICTEIIVVDDGSTDNSAFIIKKEFPFVKLIKTKNQGAAKARNIGIQESKGEFIQFLDADDILAEGKIRKQLDLLDNKGADIAYGDWQKLVRDKSGIFVKGNKIQRKLGNPEIDLFTQFWCPPAVYLFRRSIVEKAGGFKESLPVIQDARFVLDCALEKANFVYCPGVMAYYRHHSSSSLSQKDPVAFTRDIYNNAKDIERIWQKCGGITKQRKDALLTVYGYVARTTFRQDKAVFDSCLKRLKMLAPDYIPQKPKRLRLVSQIVGYQAAEHLAWWYRKVKLSLTLMLDRMLFKNKIKS